MVFFNIRSSQLRVSEEMVLRLITVRLNSFYIILPAYKNGNNKADNKINTNDVFSRKSLKTTITRNQNNKNGNSFYSFTGRHLVIKKNAVKTKSNNSEISDLVFKEIISYKKINKLFFSNVDINRNAREIPVFTNFIF